jgi:hypothetical protein
MASSWDDYFQSPATPAAPVTGSSTAGWDDYFAGTPPGQINPPSGTTLAASPQISGPARYGLGGLSALAKGAAIGLGIPGDLESAAVGGLNALGAGLPTSGGPWNTGTVLPTSSTLLEGTGRLGLTDRADLVPGYGENPTSERYGAAALQGVGSAVPTLALGGPVATTLAAGGAGGLAGEAAHSLLPGVSAAPVVAGTAAGLGVQGVASILASRSIPAIARSIGSSETWDQAGTAAQASARDWLVSTLPTKQAAAWAPVDAAIPASAGTPLTNFESALAGITSKAGSLQPVVDALSSKLPGNLQDILQNKTLVGLGISPSWSDVQQLRSAVGNAMSNPQVVKDIPAQQLSQLYAALTKDMEATATRQGAGDLFSAANAESTRLYGIAEGPMAKLVAGAKASADDPLAGKAAKSLITAGNTTGSDLGALRGEIPSAVDELASAHLLQSPSGWTKLSPEAQTALVPDLQTRARIDRAVASSTSPPPSLKDLHWLQYLAGGEIGRDVIGPALASHFPSLASPELGAATAAAGFLAPLAVRGASAVIRNPRLLRTPLAGAAGGSNALFPNPNDPNQLSSAGQ